MDYSYMVFKAVDEARISVVTGHSEKGRTHRINVSTGDPGSSVACIELTTADAMILCAKLQEAIAHKPETVEAS